MSAVGSVFDFLGKAVELAGKLIAPGPRRSRREVWRKWREDVAAARRKRKR